MSKVIDVLKTTEKVLYYAGLIMGVPLIAVICVTYIINQGR